MRKDKIYDSKKKKGKEGMGCFYFRWTYQKNPKVVLRHATCHSSKIPEECIKNIKDEVVLLNIPHFSKNKSTTYQAQITGPELSNSASCGLYLKIPKKKNYHKMYFLVDNSCNVEVILKSNILKLIYKKGE